MKTLLPHANTATRRADVEQSDREYIAQKQRKAKTMSLTYKSKAQKGIQHTSDGVIYIHHFGTGWQELVFNDHEAAARFAQSAGCVYQGPAL